MNRPLLRADGVTKSYEDDEAVTTAVDDVDLEVEAGQFVAVMGPSGSGKSTLLHLLGGLTTPSLGRVLVDDVDLTTLDDDARATLRRERFGFVFQAFNLVDVLSVEENVRLPATLAGLDGDEAAERVDHLLDLVGLGSRRRKRPAQLSGGERQRVAIARALVLRPAVVLADEPTGNLDSASGRAVLRLLRELHEDGQTIVLVTHDLKIAGGAERLLLMRDGRLQEHQRREPAEDVVEIIDRLLDSS